MMINKLSLFILCLIPSLALSAIQYPGKDRNSQRRLEIYKAYYTPDKMSHAKYHRDEAFKYLVNIIDGDLGDFGRGGIHKWAKRNTTNPNGIAGNPRICASFINQNHTKMFTGQIGLLLNVPAENFGPMRPKDIGSHSVSSYGSAARYFKRLFKQRKQYIFAPNQLIEGNKYSWNEILITGTNEYHNTKVTSQGVIFRCLNWNNLKDKYQSKLDMSSNARTTKVDLVNHPEIAYECLVNSNFLQAEFSSSPTDLKSRLMTKDEISGLTRNEKRALYLLNLRDYIIEQDSEFQALLFKM